MEIYKSLAKGSYKIKNYVALIGPINCAGGIASVVNCVLKSKEIQNNYKIRVFNICIRKALL